MFPPNRMPNNKRKKDSSLLELNNSPETNGTLNVSVFDSILTKLESIALEVKSLFQIIDNQNKLIDQLKENNFKLNTEMLIVKEKIHKIEHINENSFKQKIQNDLILFGIKNFSDSNLKETISKIKPSLKNHNFKSFKLNKDINNNIIVCQCNMLADKIELKKLFNKEHRELGIRATDRLTISEQNEKKALKTTFLEQRKMGKNAYFVRSILFVDGKKFQ